MFKKKDTKRKPIKIFFFKESFEATVCAKLQSACWLAGKKRFDWYVRTKTKTELEPAAIRLQS